MFTRTPAERSVLGLEAGLVIRVDHLPKAPGNHFKDYVLIQSTTQCTKVHCVVLTEAPPGHPRESLRIDSKQM